VLSAPTSPATKVNEETLTYLNQGQAYELKVKKIGGSQHDTGKYFKVGAAQYFKVGAALAIIVSINSVCGQVVSLGVIVINSVKRCHIIRFSVKRCRIVSDSVKKVSSIVPQ